MVLTQHQSKEKLGYPEIVLSASEGRNWWKACTFVFICLLKYKLCTYKRTTFLIGFGS